MNSAASEIRPLVMRFFRQQKELYGDELLFSDPVFAKWPRPSDQIQSLNDFTGQVYNCTKCRLSATRHHIVIGAGRPNASVMLIGEAPGEEEDLRGEPFVGKAGQLLTQILKAIEFNREDVYITNILKCRPPNNRDPVYEEIQHCLPYLFTQIQVIQPKIIVALGRVAAQTLLNTSASLNQLRESHSSFQGIPVCVTFHPAALLRNPEWKHHTWKDIQAVRHLYDRIVGDKGKWKQARAK